MKRPEINDWTAWNWLGYGTLFLSAGTLFFSTLLRDASDLSKRLPDFVVSALAYAPFPLVLLALLFFVISQKIRNRPRSSGTSSTESLLPRREIRKARYRPESEFALLPIYFQVDLTQQIPTVEVRFYVVSYLPRPILLSGVGLSLQVSSLPSIEDIPLRQNDWRIDPKEEEVIVCSRQLTNAERELPWTDGRVFGASFTLTARATDGAQKFTYGPVSSMVIEGWIRQPSSKPQAESPDAPLPSDFISLRDGATKVYEALKRPAHIWTILADRQGYGDAEAILDAMSGLIAGRIPIYGRQPPKSKIERLDVNEQTQVKFEGGGRTMRFLLFQMPACTDLQVRLPDVGALIESQRGLYAPKQDERRWPHAPAVPPLPYQRNALEQVIAHLRRSGVYLIQLPQFGRVIADASLRDGINPVFEPLSLESTQTAFAELMKEGKLRLQGDAVAIGAAS